MNKPILNSQAVAISRGPLPGSRKLLVEGVPFREVPLSGGEAPVRLYDTSGPYTDDTVAIDIEKGLGAPRREWILARGDVEEYDGRARKPADDGLKDGELLLVPQFDRAGRKPLRAKAGRNVTQLHYARQGIITQEMKFIAARENLGRSALADGNSFGAAIPDQITPEFVRARNRPRPRHHSGQHQSSRNRADDHRPQFPRSRSTPISAIPPSPRRVAEEVEKMVWAIRWGADTVMDLSTGRHPHHPRMDRAEFAGAHRHGADLSGAGEGRRRGRRPDLGTLRDTLVEQAEQGVDYFTIHAGVRLALFR